MGDFSRSVAIKALEMKKQGYTQEEIQEKTNMGIVTIRQNLNQEQLAVWDSMKDYCKVLASIDGKTVFSLNIEKQLSRPTKRKILLETMMKKLNIKID